MQFALRIYHECDIAPAKFPCLLDRLVRYLLAIELHNFRHDVESSAPSSHQVKPIHPVIVVRVEQVVGDRISDAIATPLAFPVCLMGVIHFDFVSVETVVVSHLHEGQWRDRVDLSIVRAGTFRCHYMGKKQKNTK